MTDLKKKILAMVKDDLAEIEIALSQNLKPYLELVSDTARHILFSGGKRLRPLLMVLSARICGYNGDYDKTLSAVFEYLHAATLLHDDLVDGATLRRGKPVAHLIWGNSTAVLVGDFLLARSLSLAAETGRPKVIQVIAGITENMSQGEIQQLICKGDLALSEKDYLEVIRRKTSVLIQGACRVGALISDAPQTEENALSDYGFNLGIAFQMADDLLDYTSATGVLGKEVGTDLKEGKLTLPMIFTLQRADKKDRLWIKKLIKEQDFSDSEFNLLIEKLEDYGGLAYTQKVAAKYVKKAKDTLSVFKPSKTKETLLDIADYALTREA
jgi:octaprenyl-diphosphate synthase